MDEVNVKKTNKYIPFLRQCFLTTSVSLNITGHGCVIGFSAILIPSLRLSDSQIHATASEESWIASIIGFALILGNFIVTPMINSLGRRKSHILTTIPILIGWFMIVFAENVAGLIVARFLQGVSMGMLGPLGSIIIGEMTDPRNRGPFLTGISLSLTIGVMFTHCLGSYVSWQMTALICSFITFTSLVLILFTPESPSWLVSKGRYEEAREVFFWLRGYNEEQETELENMIIAQKMARKSSVEGQTLSWSIRLKRFNRYFKETSKKPEFYKPIIIMLHIYTMFQFSGMNVISSYATDIIHDVVGPNITAEFYMVLLDVERLICNLLAIVLMKTLKRRMLLFSSGAVCILSYIALGSYVYAKKQNLLPFDYSAIPLALIGIYMFSLAVGIAPIAFTLSGEIFPLEYRGLGGGISVLGLSLNFFIAVKCFPVLKIALGLSLTYYIYAAIVAYCFVVIWALLPETKDRTLQDIEDSFRGLRIIDKMSAEPLNERRELNMRRCSSQIIY